MHTYTHISIHARAFYVYNIYKRVNELYIYICVYVYVAYMHAFFFEIWRLWSLRIWLDWLLVQIYIDWHNNISHNEIYLSVCASAYIYVWVYVFVRLHVYVNVMEYVYVYVSVYAWVYIYICICKIACIYICVCMLGYIYV